MKIIFNMEKDECIKKLGDELFTDIKKHEAKVKDLKEFHKEVHSNYWNLIQARLKEIQALPAEFNHEIHTLSMIYDHGIIMMLEDKEMMESIIKNEESL